MRLLGDGIGHPSVAVADVHTLQLRVEVDVALAVGVPEVDPSARSMTMGLILAWADHEKKV